MKELPSRMRPNRYKRPALINLTDEDARLMKSRQGVVPGYNAKAVVSPLATDKGISSMLVTPRMWWISSMTPPALSDAAHIIPDSEPEGKIVVRNGISLCRVRHAAFDRYFLAVRPGHIIEVRADILEESDGPTLRHAIQGLHDTQIILPSGLSDRPSREFLAKRFDRYRELANYQKNTMTWITIGIGTGHLMGHVMQRMISHLNMDILFSSNQSGWARRKPGNSVSDVKDVSKGVDLTPMRTSLCSISTDGRGVIENSIGMIWVRLADWPQIMLYTPDSIFTRW